MVDHTARPVPAACRGAARRHRVEGGRRRELKIRFTDAELDAITARAADAHVSVQRFMVSSSLARRPQPAVPVQLAAEVASLKRLIANLANNVNQIARRLNSGGAPDAGLPAAFGSVCRAMNRLDVALAWFDTPEAVTGSMASHQGSGGHQDPPRTAVPPPPRNDPPPGSPPPGTSP
jgi:Bacterial mobilisation protein (MobC)